MLHRRRASRDGDAVFLVCQPKAKAEKFAGSARERLCDLLELREKDAFRFCWIVDFPMYERNEETGLIEFSHNPFSMPQGGMRGAAEHGSADDQGLPVRHRLQRRRAVVRRDPQPSPGHHAEGVRHRRLRRGRGAQALRRPVPRLRVRRAAARRLGAGHRPHGDAAGRRAQHPRGHRLPDEPAGRRTC